MAVSKTVRQNIIPNYKYSTEGYI